MKYIMYGCICVCIVTLSLVMLLTVGTRSIRENELEENVHLTAEEVMRDLVTTDVYQTANEKSLEEEFYNRLKDKMQSDVEKKGETITVNIYGSDTCYGLLLVDVTETFSYPNGKKGECQAEAAILLDQKTEKEECEVRFYVGDVLWYAYQTDSGGDFILPVDPEEEDFLGWSEQKDSYQAAEFPTKVMGDQIYYGHFMTAE